MRSHIITSTRPITKKGSADRHQEGTTTRPSWKSDAMTAVSYMMGNADRQKLPNQHNDRHTASTTYAGI